MALQNGVDVKTVSSMLGHYSAGFTLDTYAHVTTDAQLKACLLYTSLLYEDVGDSYIGAVFAARSMELWLLEDMGFAVVAKFSVNAGEGEYVTEYRVYKRLLKVKHSKVERTLLILV